MAEPAVGVSTTRARLDRLVAFDFPAVATWLLAAVLPIYLALKGGGYDTIVRNEIGIAVWWILLVGALFGFLPAARVGRAAWVAISAILGLTAWTALSISWSESAERSADELSQIVAYAGIFALAVAVQGRASARHVINGLATGIGVVAALAVLSRLHPAWFPDDESAALLPPARTRLDYPLNYWNALAALMALGIPVLLCAASSARTLAGQAVAAAAFPLLPLVGFLAVSRGGAVAAAAAVTVFMVLVPGRLPKLATLTAGAAGGALLIAGAAQRSAITEAEVAADASGQGTEMLVMALVVCAGVGLIQVGIGLAVRHVHRPSWTRVGRRPMATALAVVVALAGATALTAGVPGELSERWREFKQPSLTISAERRESAERFQASSGQGRYQYWQSALDANATRPLSGIGAGTWEYWWARHGTLPGFVRDAHSLYMETLAELGIIGLLLLGGFFLWILATGTVRSLRSGGDERVPIAAATAGCSAFAVSAAVDWVWELAALAAAFLLLAAVVAAARGDKATRSEARARILAARAAVGAVSVAAIVAMAIPLAGVTAVRDSEAHLAERQGAAAIDDALAAQEAQPYAATPELQQALVLEQAGDLDGAARAAREATAAESTNWRTWLVLSRVEAQRGNARDAVDAYRRARSLNPRSPLFAE